MLTLPQRLLVRAAYRVIRPVLIRALIQERDDGDSNEGEWIRNLIWFADLVTGVKGSIPPRTPSETA